MYENFPVKLYSNGNVDFVPAVHLTSECIFNNYGQFPFEYEICDFQVCLYENWITRLKLNICMQ